MKLSKEKSHLKKTACWTSEIWPTRRTWTCSFRLSSTKNIVCPSRQSSSPASQSNTTEGRRYWNSLILVKTPRHSSVNLRYLHKSNSMTTSNSLVDYLRSSDLHSVPKRKELSSSWVTVVSIWTRLGYTSWRADRPLKPQILNSGSLRWASRCFKHSTSFTKLDTVTGTSNSTTYVSRMAIITW